VSGRPRIVYTPRPDATPEAELAALATVYAFVMQRHNVRKAAEGSGGKDHARKDKDAPRANDILPQKR
jgi:hypothetical protein